MAIKEKMEALIESLEESHNVDKIAADFMAIVDQKDKQSAHRWLSVLLAGYANGEIYNADYKEVKFNLGRDVERAWRSRTDKYWVGRGGDNPESSFLDLIGSPSNLTDILSRKKRIDKFKPTSKVPRYGADDWKGSDVDPGFVSAAYDVISAAYPVALIVKEMKSKVVKGRKPPSKEVQAKKAAALAKKDMKTCACCFRVIARVKNGKIADHGFTLNNYWGHGRSGSCLGREFKPLEVSNEGLKYMVKTLKARLKDLSKSKRTAPKLTSLYKKKGWSGKNLEKIGKDHPDWDRTMQMHMLNLDSDIKSTTNGLKDYEARLRVWQKTSD